MAPQSLDLGLSLGLGVAAFQPSFCHPAGNAAVAAAAEREASPAAAEERERRCSPAGSPVSSGSGSGSGKRAAAERSAGSGSGDEDDDGAARKKLRLSKDQAAVLEECFKMHHTLTPKQKVALASSLGLRPRQVEVWFQNRRARTKLKQTEVDCEYLKRWCEQLAEENRRLGKEVAELRALSAAPAPAAPLTTLTMCLSCRRVSSSSSPSSNTSSPNISTAHAHAHAAAATSVGAAANAGSMASPAAAPLTGSSSAGSETPGQPPPQCTGPRLGSQRRSGRPDRLSCLLAPSADLDLLCSPELHRRCHGNAWPSCNCKASVVAES